MSEIGVDKIEQGTKRLKLAKFLEKFLLFFIAIVLVILTITLYQQNKQLQNYVAATGRVRTDQLDQLLKQQDALDANAEEVKNYIRCVVIVLRTTTNSDTEALDKCAKENIRPQPQSNKAEPSKTIGGAAVDSPAAIMPLTADTTRSNTETQSGGAGDDDEGNDMPPEFTQPNLLDFLVDGVDRIYNGVTGR